jgi:catalase
LQGRDAKAGEPGTALDPRVVLLLSELFRHAKAIGGWGPAITCLDAASIPADAEGIALGEGPDEVVGQLIGLLAAHRAWERFPAQGA